MTDAVAGRIWFRPRVLRDVSKVDFSTKILGFKTSMPVYIVCPLFRPPATSADRVG